MLRYRNLNAPFTIRRYGQGESMAAASDDQGTVNPTAQLSPGIPAASSSVRAGLAATLSSGLSLIKAVPASILASLLGFVTVWLFVLSPGLRPGTPVEERPVSISNAVVAKRHFPRRDDREEVTVVTFEADVTGYAANPITVATLW